jgi:hypothetical protein
VKKMITDDIQSRVLALMGSTAAALAMIAGAAAPALATAPQPRRGHSVIVSRVHGRIAARTPGGHRFTTLTRPRSLPVGGFVDASAGTAGVKIAIRSRDRSAQISHGTTQVQQTSSGTTTFKLTGGLNCGKAAGIARRHPGHSSRSLWVRDHGGPFATRGQYVSAAAEGTFWITTDYCDHTVVRVRQGKVLVNNLVTHQKVTVTAGHSYTAGAAAAPAFAWSQPAPIGNGGALNAISCPTASFCAAVNTNGDVLTSTGPAGGASTWSTTPIVSDSGLSDISCPTASFCVAADTLTGDVLISANPTGGAATWTATNIVNPVGDALQAVDCPSSSLCVGVDSSGNEITSTNPTGGSGAWTAGAINPGNSFSDLTCTGGALCVAVGAGLSATATPAAGVSGWHTTTALAMLSALSCPSTSLCVVGDSNGNVYVSANPTGGPATYKETEAIDSLHPFQPITGISCVPSGECVVVGLSGDAVVSADPSGGAQAWKTKTADTSTGLTAVSCPTAGLCFASDQTGDVVVGTAS